MVIGRLELFTVLVLFYPRILESLNIKKGPGKQKDGVCAVLF